MAIGVLVFAGDYLDGVVDSLEGRFGRSFWAGIATQLALAPVLASPRRRSRGHDPRRSAHSVRDRGVRARGRGAHHARLPRDRAHHGRVGRTGGEQAVSRRAARRFARSWSASRSTWDSGCLRRRSRGRPWSRRCSAASRSRSRGSRRPPALAPRCYRAVAPGGRGTVPALVRGGERPPVADADARHWRRRRTSPDAVIVATANR